MQEQTKMGIQVVGQPGGSKATIELVDFLIARQDKSKSFFVGNWLEKAKTETLAHLDSLIERFLAGEYSKELDDLFSFTICALAAERCVKKVNVSDEIFINSAELLKGLISIENARRLGWLTIHSPLSIELDSSVDVEFTDEGIKQGGKLRPA